MKLAGQSAIISGASQGLGLEVAKQFVAEGANVMICARSSDALKEAEKELQKIAPANVKVCSQITDIANKEDVDRLITSTLKAFNKIDILVANAGVYGTKGAIDEIDWEEWSNAIDINLKGTVLQCRAVLPHFRKQHKGKIIILSGGGATKPLPFLSAYAASKAAVVRFAETLALELIPFHIDVNTVAPGALNTRLLDEVLAAGPEKVGKDFYQAAIKQKENGGTPLSVGADLCVFLSSSESDGITGRLISAVWDPWKKLPSYLNDLNQSDIYTLRRIVPEERGKAWSEA